MSDSHNANPFVLPGMGQSSDLSGNPLLASMDMMRQAWASLAGPGGLAQVLPMGSPLNIEELERRIAELRSVESWLRMNLSMLDSTIQGMEVQRATISTLRSFVDKVSTLDPSSKAGSNAPSPLEVALGLKPAPGKAQAKAKAAEAETAPPPAPASGQGADAAASASADSAALNSAAHTASQAWWSLLQQQFNNIAAATTASMAGVQQAQSKAAETVAASVAKTVAKSATKSTVAKSASKTSRKKPAPRVRKAAEPSSRLP